MFRGVTVKPAEYETLWALIHGFRFSAGVFESRAAPCENPGTAAGCSTFSGGRGPVRPVTWLIGGVTSARVGFACVIDRPPSSRQFGGERPAIVAYQALPADDDGSVGGPSWVCTTGRYGVYSCG